MTGAENNAGVRVTERRWVNFINNLRADPKAEKDSKVVSLFARSESGRAKTTGRMLMFMFMQGFYAQRSQSIKIQSSQQYLFALWDLYV
jgi:hypothetical protein